MNFLNKLNIQLPKPQVIWCDNLSTVMLSANPIQHAKTKLIELDNYFVSEKVLQGSLIVKHVPSSDQTGDVLTKVVSSSGFHILCRKLGVQQLSTLSLREGVSSKWQNLS